MERPAILLSLKGDLAKYCIFPSHAASLRREVTYIDEACRVCLLCAPSRPRSMQVAKRMTKMGDVTQHVSCLQRPEQLKLDWKFVIEEPLRGLDLVADWDVILT